MAFKIEKLKSSYVGELIVFNFEKQEVLFEGSASFNLRLMTLDTLLVVDKTVQEATWLPIIKTEDGYFSPSQLYREDFVSIGFSMFPSKNRRTFNMSSFFHWPLEQGLNHIATKVSDVVIDVEATHTNEITYRSDKSVQSVIKGHFEEIDKVSFASYEILAKALYGTKGHIVSPMVRFRLTKESSPFSFDDWLGIVHSFRLYWALRHDHIDCTVANFALGNHITLITNMLNLKGYTDNTYPIKNALDLKTPLEIETLAKTLDLFIDARPTRNNGIEKIRYSFFRFLKVRFGRTQKHLGDDALDFIFAMDGFSSAISKNIVSRSIPKAKSLASISKIVQYVKENEDSLEPAVVAFYDKPIESIYELLSHRPYKESVRLCLTELGMNYDDYASLIKNMDDIRQTFVHGKGYNTQELAEILYTHGTQDIVRDDQNNVVQISFGQKMGLVDEYYKLLLDVYRHYFDKYYPKHRP